MVVDICDLQDSTTALYTLSIARRVNSHHVLHIYGGHICYVFVFYLCIDVLKRNIIY